MTAATKKEVAVPSDNPSADRIKIGKIKAEKENAVKLRKEVEREAKTIVREMVAKSKADEDRLRKELDEKQRELGASIKAAQKAREAIYEKYRAEVQRIVPVKEIKCREKVGGWSGSWYQDDERTEKARNAVVDRLIDLCIDGVITIEGFDPEIPSTD